MDEVTTPVAGWYDDPEMALRLRWWDGERWTSHTRAKQIVESAAAETAWPATTTSEHPVVNGSVGEAATATIAAPNQAGRYSDSAPQSLTPVSPVMPSGTMSGRTRSADELWNTTANSVNYAPERSSTPASWMLAATPLVTALAHGAALLLQSTGTTPVLLLIGAAIIPLLWIIMWMVRDRATLHAWGHLKRASGWWILLGALGYLVARTIVVRRQNGRGWWPLVVYLAFVALLVNLGRFTPVFGVLRELALPML